MKPSGIQRRAPFTPLPTNGRRTTHEQQQRGDEDPRRELLPDRHRHLDDDQRGHEGDREREQVAGQEVGRRVAREARVVGQRHGGAVDHHQAEREQRDDDGDERAVEAEQARRLAALDADPLAHRDRLGRPRGRRAAAVLARAAVRRRREQTRPSQAGRRDPSAGCSCARSRRCSSRRVGDRAHGGDEHLGAMPVVAEHVEARAGRAEQHRVAGPCRAGKGGADRASSESKRCKGTPAVGDDGLDRRGASRPIVSAARACRRSGTTSGAKSWPLPSPPRMTTSLAGARSAPRPSSAATVAPTLVPLLSSKASTPSTLATYSTRCGSPRYSRSACSIGASGQPIGAGQRERGERVGRVVAAAHAQRVGRHQAAAAHRSSARRAAALARRARRVPPRPRRRARTSQAMSFSIDEAEVAAALRRARRRK